MTIFSQKFPSFLTCRPSLRSLSFFSLLTCMLWLLFRISSYDQLHKLDLQNILPLHQNLSHRPLVVDMPDGKEKQEADMPSVDKSPKLNETELVNKLEPQMPNLPAVYWQENKHKQMSKNESCARYPDIYDLRFNKYWQVFESSNGTYNLYAAYLDVRKLNPLGPTIRILAMINRLEPWKLDTFCQLWFDDTKEPVFAKIDNIYLIWQTWWANYAHGLFQVHLLHLHHLNICLFSHSCCLASYLMNTWKRYQRLYR